MSILQIGRVFDTYDADVATAAWGGPNRLSLAGEVYLSSVAAADRPEVAMAIRDRFISLGNDDEAIVPVVWSEDPSVDGFYRPLDPQVSYTLASLNDGLIAWQVELEKVGGASLPQHEVASTYTHIVNGFSAALATINAASNVAISACPDAAYDAWNGFTQAQGNDRTSETGALAIFERATAVPFSTLHLWSVTPDDAYVGACSLRGTYAGIANQLCLGDMACETNGLVLSNGLVRAKLTAGVLTIEVYDSGAWVTTSATGWTFEGGSGTIGTQTPDLDAAPYVSVLRNSPEAVSIRLLVNPSGAASPAGRMWLDLGVKRGSMLVTANPRDDHGLAWSVRSTNAVAGTSINGGVRQTSNDGSGNRLLVVGRGTVRNLVNIGVNTGPFGLGVELGGSGATGNAQAQQVAYEWFVGRSEAQRVVRR